MPDPLDDRIARVESHTWDAGRDRWQEIRNARPIPARRLQREGAPIPIRARLVWERDGEEWIDTQASVWTDRDVLVELADPRWRVHGVWVGAGDVGRR